MIKPSSTTYVDRFGSFTNALLSAGLEPRAAPVGYRKNDRASIPLSLRFAVLMRDGFTCQYCGGTPQEGYVLHADHRIPVAHGGETTEDNLVTSCSLCNLGKSDLVNVVTPGQLSSS